MSWSADDTMMIQDWIKQKFPSGLKCPACGGALITPIAPGAIVGLDAKGRPDTNAAPFYVFSFLCENCAYVLSFSIDKIGPDPTA